MALEFVKKVFSFGKKESVKQPAEDEKLPLLNFDALEALRPAEEILAAPETPVADAPAVPVDSAPQNLPEEEPKHAPSEVPALPSEPSVSELPEEILVQCAPEPGSVAEESAIEASVLVVAEPVVGQRPVEPVAKATKLISIESPEPAQAPVDELVAALREAVSEFAPAAPEPAPKPSAGKVTVQKKVEQKTEVVEVAAPAPKRDWFHRLRQGLSRSSKELSGNIAGIFTKRKLDEETMQDLEDVLIRADLGVETALNVTGTLAASRYGKDISDTEVHTIMAVEIEKVLSHVAVPLDLDLSHKPHVILVVGVNGTGKTTTIGKLAAKLTEGGLSVMLAAGDTFRAAAIEQLKIWGERTKSPVIASKLGADAAGLAYDAFEKAKEADADVLIIDTAGRLQNKTELMAELEKIVRVLGKLDTEAPHTVLQTVDATTGQNALNQVEIFRNIADVTGLVMTKLDGTARGGILVAIAAKHKLPVYFIGVGEQVDDLEPFSASDFAKAIAGVE